MRHSATPPRQTRYRRICSYILLFVLPLCLPGIRAEQWDITARQINAIGTRYGEAAKLRIQSWLDLIHTAKTLSEPQKIEAVNRFFNQMRFQADSEVWGVEDYWATPVEFLIANAGDCEDFSLAKYFTLKALEVPVERMRITYVRALRSNPVSQAHMVLTYYPAATSDPLVLDNLIGDIRPASQRPDLHPVYSFNGDGLWIAKQRGEGQLVGQPSRMGVWNGVMRRMTDLWTKLADD